MSSLIFLRSRYFKIIDLGAREVKFRMVYEDSTVITAGMQMTKSQMIQAARYWLMYST